MTVRGMMTKGFSPDLALSGSRVTFNDPLLDYRKQQHVFNASYVNQYSTRNLNDRFSPPSSEFNNLNLTNSRPASHVRSDRLGSGASQCSTPRGSLPAFHVNRGTCHRISTPGGASPRRHIESHIRHEQDYIERALNLKRFRIQQNADSSDHAHKPDAPQPLNASLSIPAKRELDITSNNCSGFMFSL